MEHQWKPFLHQHVRPQETMGDHFIGAGLELSVVELLVSEGEDFGMRPPVLNELDDAGFGASQLNEANELE
jgi:hypothetical protein